MVVVTPRPQVAGLTCGVVVDELVFEALFFGKGGTWRIHCLVHKVETLTLIVDQESFVLSSALLGRSEMQLGWPHFWLFISYS